MNMRIGMTMMVGLSVAGLTAGTQAVADSVVPTGLELIEGNSSTEGPFEAFGRSYQQVYNASAFDGSPISISGVSFRADGSVADAINTTRGADGFPVVFKLSTTSAAADSLSTIFSDNVGSDVATVFSGTLDLSTGPVGGSPNDFGVTVTFDSAFNYDPSAGNLLLEINKFSSDIFADALPLDAEDTLGDATSSLAGLSPMADQGLASTLGLVTSFVTGPAGPDGPNVIPTPSAALLGLGLVGLNLVRRRRGADA